ncbi:hypothetical protein CFP75_38350 [Amycolatopsis alba DSM 44262]|uniref:DUF6545 domain-containing protein n=1 Tax=Amycolatopsis alba DSM 44262 TaxID=1125972 RepID=A0A229RAD1_AMYAL|nr:hypothetical protein CFP75_38350 [Amycolatopsis alba DSM 44262]
MFDLHSAVAYFAALVALGECVRKLISDRHVPSALSRDYLAGGLLFSGVSLVAGAPATMRWGDQCTGLPHFTYLIHCLVTMAAMVCMAGFLRAVTMTTVRMRTTGALFAGCAGALAALYVSSGPADPLFGISARQPASLAFTLIYLVFMITWIVAFIRGAWRISRGTDMVVRFGIFLAVLGMGVGLIGLVWKAITLLDTLVRSEQVIRNPGFTLLAEACGAVLFAAGSGFASAVRRIDESRARRRTESIKCLWERLRPVWSQSGLYNGLDESDFRRQIVQVFDAWLLLRSYVHPALQHMIAIVIAERRLGARRGARVTAAAELRGALAAFENGLDAAAPAQSVDPAPQPTMLMADERRELDWIAEVAQAWTDDAVTEIMERVRRRGYREMPPMTCASRPPLRRGGSVHEDGG